MFPDIILTSLMEMDISSLYDIFNLPYQALKSRTFFHEHVANYPEVGQQSEFAYIVYLAINGKSPWCPLSVVRGPLDKDTKSWTKKEWAMPTLLSKFEMSEPYALCSMPLKQRTTDH
ncbi:MAG: hypothetical protein GWN93_16545 [Deltaproteobacteria bacterium]|nr:hypothetical protein [Deltaproteobacteria bacterium]